MPQSIAMRRRSERKARISGFWKKAVKSVREKDESRDWRGGVFKPSRSDGAGCGKGGGALEAGGRGSAACGTRISPAHEGQGAFRPVSSASAEIDIPQWGQLNLISDPAWGSITRLL